MKKSDVRLLLNSEYIGFDCFDTLIHRRCHPETIKQVWAKKLCQKYELDVSAEKLWRIRKSVEAFLEGKNENGEYTYNELITEIFRRYNVYYKSREDTKFKAPIHEIKQLEIDIETERQYLDNENADLLVRLYNSNKKIIIISDFYMGKKEIYTFLKRFHLDQYIYDVFVSCDLKKCKKNGSIYDEIGKQFLLNENNFVMIGDNYKSDFKVPKHKGYNAVYFRYKRNERRVSYHSVERELWKLNRKKKEVFNGYAFGLYLFSDVLLDELKKSQSKDVFFLSREGEFLKKIFELLQNRRGKMGEPKAHYFLCSRLGTFVPGLKEADKERFETLFRQYNTISIKQFLASIGFSDDNIKHMQEICIFDLEKTIVDIAESLELKTVMQLPDFLKLYDSIRNEQDTNFKNYCASFGVDFQKEALCIVDVGWKGTIQDNLYRFFEGSVEINGFYLGLREEGRLNPRNNKRGLLFSKGPYESEDYCIWDSDFQFWEKILAGSHGGVKRYENKNLNHRMVCLESERNAEYELIKEVQNNIFKTICEIEGIFSESCYQAADFQKLFVKIHLKTLCHMSLKEMKLYLKLRESHYENFGLFSYESEKVRARGFRMHNPFNIQFIRAVYVTLYRYHLHCFFWLYGIAVYNINMIWRKLQWLK